MQGPVNANLFATRPESHLTHGHCVHKLGQVLYLQQPVLPQRQNDTIYITLNNDALKKVPQNNKKKKRNDALLF